MNEGLVLEVQDYTWYRSVHEMPCRLGLSHTLKLVSSGTSKRHYEVGQGADDRYVATSISRSSTCFCPLTSGRSTRLFSGLTDLSESCFGHADTNTELPLLLADIVVVVPVGGLIPVNFNFFQRYYGQLYFSSCCITHSNFGTSLYQGF